MVMHSYSVGNQEHGYGQVPDTTTFTSYDLQQGKTCNVQMKKQRAKKRRWTADIDSNKFCMLLFYSTASRMLEYGKSSPGLK
jgi:hypothetical protein